LAISLVQRLETRNLPGDEELAQDLLAAVRRESPPGRPLPVDLEELSGLLEGDPASNEGGFLDLRTGEVIPAFMVDESMVGADAAVDVDAEPDRWERVSCGVPGLGGKTWLPMLRLLRTRTCVSSLAGPSRARAPTAGSVTSSVTKA
jgi:hypothetical protein